MRITVVGGGSWWTALAKILAEKGLDVYLLVRREAVCEAINREKEEETKKCKNYWLSLILGFIGVMIP